MRLLIIFILLTAAPAALAQAVAFTGEGVKYELELPSTRWRPLPRLDVHDHFDFIKGGDRADGYLRVREHLVKAGTTPEELFRREESRTLRLLPGYVGCAPCAGESFAGRLSGAVFSYEYTSGGRQMAGRIYYLRADERMYYSLHLTCARERLGETGTEADAIARSFRLK